MNVFVFDIETVPDVAGGRKLLELEGLSDCEVAEAMFLKSREERGSEFIRLHLQKIVAISAVFRHRDSLKVWSLGDENSSEKELIERFFSGVTKFMPTLVSWNGSGFDLPVLHYRALINDVVAPVYWETGDFDNNFKWNNYLNRYHNRHLDLMDVLAGYQAKANAPLQDIAVLLGLPGKMGMVGSKVWQAYVDGDIKGIRNYCETDVLNTYLVYLKFEYMRGKLNPEEYEYECDLVYATLEDSKLPHFEEFAREWRG